MISRESLVAGHWSLVMGDATWLAVVLGGGPDYVLAPRTVGVLEPTRGKLER